MIIIIANEPGEQRCKAGEAAALQSREVLHL